MKTVLNFTAIFIFIVLALSFFNYKEKFNALTKGLEREIATDLMDPQPHIIKKRVSSLHGLGFRNLEILTDEGESTELGAAFIFKKEIYLDGLYLGSVVSKADLFTVLEFTISSFSLLLIIFFIYISMVYLIIAPLVSYKKSVENFIFSYKEKAEKIFPTDKITEKISEIIDANILQAVKNNHLAEVARKNEEILNLSQKVAHDIRSPISTLNLISVKISDPDLKRLQLAVVDQINFIANDLLFKTKANDTKNELLAMSDLRKSNSSESDTCTSERKIFSFFKDFENELAFKQSEISQEVVFDVEYEAILKLSQSHSAETGTIKRCLDNFIQNALEATPSNGRVTISGFFVGNKVELSVSDNGKGIPKEILQRLGSEKLSFGKNKIDNEKNSSGNGIALFNAKRDLAAIGAELKIYSVVNKGTTVSILI